MRKLATIRQIQSVEPIVGKDRVELAHVDGWTCMVSKADAYAKALEYVQDNPVLDHTPGERRVLRGYKLQFVSRDGKYRCIDMDITDGNAERLVNINTISELVFNGVKYIVK